MQVVAETSDSLLLIGAMQIAEFAIANDLEVGESTGQLLLENRKQFIATKQVVPEERHTGTVERCQTVCPPLLLNTSR